MANNYLEIPLPHAVVPQVASMPTQEFSSRGIMNIDLLKEEDDYPIVASRKTCLVEYDLSEGEGVVFVMAGQEEEGEKGVIKSVSSSPGVFNLNFDSGTKEVSAEHLAILYKAICGEHDVVMYCIGIRGE